MAGILRNVSFLLHGSKHFGWEGYTRAAKNFNPSVMERKLDGKVVLITGANQGLGLQASKDIASRGATLLMVCRNPEKGQKAVEDVRALTGNQDVHLKVCDMSSLSSIRQLVDDLKASRQPLHVVISNAGVMTGTREKSLDGVDLNTATNTLGAWVLALLLGPLLMQSAPSRFIFMSSGGMLTQKLEVVDLQNEGMGKHYDGTTAYARDKRRLVAIAERLAEMWEPHGVHVYSMHPGWVGTEGVKESMPSFYKFYKDKFRDHAQGVDTAVYLALQDSEQLIPGGFYLDRHPQAKHLSFAGTHYTSKQVDLLWANLLALVPKDMADLLESPVRLQLPATTQPPAVNQPPAALESSTAIQQPVPPQPPSVGEPPVAIQPPATFQSPAAVPPPAVSSAIAPAKLAA